MSMDDRRNNQQFDSQVYERINSLKEALNRFYSYRRTIEKNIGSLEAVIDHIEQQIQLTQDPKEKARLYNHLNMLSTRLQQWFEAFNNFESIVIRYEEQINSLLLNKERIKLQQEKQGRVSDDTLLKDLVDTLRNIGKYNNTQQDNNNNMINLFDDPTLKDEKYDLS